MEETGISRRRFLRELGFGIGAFLLGCRPDPESMRTISAHEVTVEPENNRIWFQYDDAVVQYTTDREDRRELSELEQTLRSSTGGDVRVYGQHIDGQYPYGRSMSEAAECLIAGKTKDCATFELHRVDVGDMRFYF